MILEEGTRSKLLFKLQPKAFFKILPNIKFNSNFAAHFTVQSSMFTVFPSLFFKCPYTPVRNRFDTIVRLREFRTGVPTQSDIARVVRMLKSTSYGRNTTEVKEYSVKWS